MNETEGCDDVRSYETRYKEVMKKKRKNLDTMKQLKRRQVKAKLEKKRINLELKNLQAEWQELIKRNPEEAKSKFSQELKNVSIDEIFPPDLEKEFDNIELRHMRGGRTMKTEDLRKDKDLVVPGNIVKAMERELEQELKDEEVVPTDPNDAVDPIDEQMQLQLIDPSISGLSENDIIINEDGEEEEITDEDEDKDVDSGR